jgi:hypothetical protein
MEDDISGTRVPCGGEVHTALDGEPEGKGPLGRPRPRREDSVKRIFNKYSGRACLDSSGLR